MPELLTLLDNTVMQLPQYFWDANKRIFIIYLLSALLMASLLYYKSEHKKSLSLSQFLFPKKVWLHASAKLDYLLWPLNKIIKVILIAPLLFTMVPIAIEVSTWLSELFGQQRLFRGDRFAIALSFTFILFLFDDFSRFLLHWLLHKVPFLWAFHQVHHSAKVLTPFTIYRSHPVENLLYAMRMALAQGLAVGVCYFLFGPTLKMLDILGANLFIFVFNLLGSNLRHSHIWFAWGDKIENWFISPAQHQIHHSSAKIHFDANFGTALAIWDQLFGSLIKSSTVTEPSRLTLGVAGAKENLHSTIWDIYWQPFVASFNILKRRLLKDKV